MTPCLTCDLCEMLDGNKYPRSWLCMEFRQDEVDPLTGGVMPPYKPCYQVRQIAVPNQAEGYCRFWKAKPEEKEPIIKDARGGRSVTFKEKD